ncbi:ABC transporter substrate-binding protein [Marinobacterium stanieri]|uniref:ABC transporter substrate-binding protein n=1 Tax=Marinobacterium stanieri TaxID=49186 RepID=UPI000255A3D6|nr:ABC transporter substrate-binding protein [Marinobacterium stanieri]
MSKRLLTLSLAALTSVPAWANCPAITGPDAGGEFPHLYERSAYEQLNNCTLSFKANPDIAVLNQRISGNPELPPLAQRLPKEPLVIAPYGKIGQYGGVLDGISKATESGTSDLLSVRHVNLLRFSDDLSTIVPNVAKSWEWNAGFTELTLTLREGHKWSDGEPFTAEDIAFWYNHLIMDPKVTAKPKDRFLSEGKPMTVEALSPTQVRFTLNAPRPGLTAMFANDYAQPFQPKHLLGRFHPAINPEADALAQSLGFEDGYAALTFYYGQSDWKDVPTPLLKDKDAVKRLQGAGLPAVAPTLESHIVIEDTLEGRRLVANPYFFQVDTAGQQLPYINEISEIYIGDEDIQTAKMIAGEVDYKAQAVNLPSAPVLLENRQQGNYEIALRPTIGLSTIAFNLTDKDAEKRALFNKVEFRQAMSLGIDRERINEVAYFGLGKPMQYTAFDPDTAPFATDTQKNAFIEYNPEQAKSLLDAAGLTDRDGDGWRDLPSGERLDLDIRYATQGIATKVVEIISANWRDLGVRTSMKEVTSDEYRNSQTANDLSVLTWTMGRPQSVVASDSSWLIPPYGTFFDLRTGMEWARYLQTEGAEGSQPPQSVMDMLPLAEAFTQKALGSDESAEIGRKIAQLTVDDLFIIGTAKAVSPVYFSKKLKNFEVPKTSSYDYYRMYPYLPTQWYLED